MNIVLYHAHCTDGFGAAFAAWLHLGDGETVYLPVRYGDPVPEEVWGRINDGDVRLYILDFSYPATEMERLLYSSGNVKTVLLDHHRTALPLLDHRLVTDFADKLTLKIDEKKSGAVLAWEYFDKTPPPEMFLYIQDYDLWEFILPNSRAINAMLNRGCERTFTHWECMLGNWHMDRDAFKRMGQTLLDAEEATLEMLSNHPDYCHGRDGELVLRVNSPVLRNELAERLLKNYPLAEYVEIWYERNNERRTSLRSRKHGFDVTVVAERMGGGGHPSAAAYRQPAFTA